MKKKNLLKIIISDLKNKKELYQPTSFWKSASDKLENIFLKNKISSFKRNNIANNFFIPLYGFKKNINISVLKSYLKKNKKISKKFISYFLNLYSGESHALSDYRVFKAANDDSKYPLLENFSESKVGNPFEQFTFEKKKLQQIIFKLSLGTCFFEKKCC